MGIRTTLTLDEDVFERVKHESVVRGRAFCATLNDLLRSAFLHIDRKPSRRKIKIKPVRMGFPAGVNCDKVESLLAYGESEQHR